MTEEKLSIRLNTIHCSENNEEKFDDVYIMFRKKKIWPEGKKQKPIRSNTKQELQVTLTNLTHGEPIAIEIWDYDIISCNDLLGTIYLTPTNMKGKFLAEMSPVDTRETARYSVEWEVIYSLFN